MIRATFPDAMVVGVVHAEVSVGLHGHSLSRGPVCSCSPDEEFAEVETDVAVVLENELLVAVWRDETVASAEGLVHVKSITNHDEDYMYQGSGLMSCNE